MLGDDLARHATEISPHLLERNARLEPADAEEPRMIAAIERRGVEVGSKRQPHVQRLDRGQCERRQHANDSILLSIERNSLAEHCRIAAELGAPVAGREQRDEGSTGPILLWKKVAPEQRLRAEQMKKIGRGRPNADLSGHIAGRVGLPAKWTIECDVLEDSAACLP